MEFEWDLSKATSNLRKHGVSFEEAQTVFANSLAVIFGDEAHSVGHLEKYQKRCLILGLRL
jgi:uncharacterized DUF497 family protein